MLAHGFFVELLKFVRWLETLVTRIRTFAGWVGRHFAESMSWGSCRCEHAWLEMKTMEDAFAT